MRTSLQPLRTSGVLADYSEVKATSMASLISICLRPDAIYVKLPRTSSRQAGAAADAAL